MIGGMLPKKSIGKAIADVQAMDDRKAGNNREAARNVLIYEKSLQTSS
jgi:hypothetical protein